jgi:hypothetical protein
MSLLVVEFFSLGTYSFLFVPFVCWHYSFPRKKRLSSNIPNMIIPETRQSGAVE